MTQPLRALVVDDEPLARAHLRALLSDDPDVLLVGECGNGRDAIAAIRESGPDLVFLDIQMPELDGFGVVREMGADKMPVVVFVTAYDDYALKAFGVYALDYLLKPVDRRRFQETLARAKSQIARARSPADSTAVSDRLTHLLDHLAKREPDEGRLAIKVRGRILLLKTDDIDWIEAVDDHARLHVGRTAHLVRVTLARLVGKLPATKFLRIHRSTIINVDRVRELQPWFQGEYVIILNDGTRLTSGRSYNQAVRTFLERSS